MPGWAVEVFGRLRAANGGTLSGFFDVFAWREPGRVAFFEAKVGPDRIKPTQLRFVEIALRFHRLDDFMIVEIPGPSPHTWSARQTATTAGQMAARRLVTAGSRSGGRDLQPALRRPAPAGRRHDARREQQLRRAARWTADDVINAVVSCGDDAAAIARSVISWAAGPHLRLAGGTGLTYPSLTVEADSGRTTSRWRGVLTLYASPHGGPPALEVRLRTMCRTPPHDRQHDGGRLTGGLHALGIPRLDRERDLAGLRPEIPLCELKRPPGNNTLRSPNRRSVWFGYAWVSSSGGYRMMRSGVSVRERPGGFSRAAVCSTAACDEVSACPWPGQLSGVRR